MRPPVAPTHSLFLLFVAFLLPGFAAAAVDTDGDGLIDDVDNCVYTANGPAEDNQLDADEDGYGNACDGDFDQNGFVNSLDFGVFLTCFNSGSPEHDPDCTETDMNDDGVHD